MGIFDRFKQKNEERIIESGYKIVTMPGEGFFSFNGNIYQSDIVRTCIRPKAQAVGKAIGKHIRNDSINPDPYIRFLLEEPNQYMSGQMLQEKLTVQLMLNNNAYALIQRNENNLANAIYPIPGENVEALQDKQGRIFLRFFMKGKYYTFKYDDIIHIRRDFSSSDIFGDSQAQSLVELMEVVTTADQGLINAIKNSNTIKWLLKFNQTLRDEDIKANTRQFIDTFMSIDSGIGGAAATDAKFDATQVEPKNYIPDSSHTNQTVDRIYSFFNTNKKIVQSSYNEDERISYYEAEIEPVVMQLSNEFTRKIFTRKERGHGNKIIFDSGNLAFASMKTKLQLAGFVDRGIMNPDEVREVLNIAPIPDGLGKQYIRRLDTEAIKMGGEDDEEDKD